MAPRFRKPWFARVLSVLVLRALRTRVLDARFIPRDGPVLLAANHQSFADGVLLVCASPRPLVILIDAVQAARPLFRPVLRAFEALGLGECVLVTPGQGTRALEQAAARLAEGHCVLIFPEGAITRDAQLGTLRRGLFRLANQARAAPVVPVRLTGLATSCFGCVAPRRGWPRARLEVYPPLRARDERLRKLLCMFWQAPTSLLHTTPGALSDGRSPDIGL